MPGRVSANWVLTDTRLPEYTLFEDLAEGAAIYDFIKWFGRVDEFGGESGAGACGTGPPG